MLLNKILFSSLILISTSIAADPDNSVSTQDITNEQKFINAAAHGNLESVKEYIATGGDVNVKDRYGNTALMFAATNGHVELVQMLLQVPNIDINAASDCKETALLMLITFGLKRNLKDQYFEAPRHLEILKLLLNHPDIDINKAGYWYNETPLIAAIISGSTEAVKLLLKKPEIDLNATECNYGGTPLIWAVQRGGWCFDEIIDLLIQDPRTNINYKDKAGNTALDYALIYGPGQLFEDLLSSLRTAGAKTGNAL